MGDVRFESAGDHLGAARAVVTERAGGVSKEMFRSLNLGRWTPDDSVCVRENERRVRVALALPDRVARLRLEHGARVLEATEAGEFGPADAIWTDQTDLVLTLTVADCYPVAIAGRQRRALIHCGWRGVAAQVLESTCAAIVAESNLRAWIGPGICARCYPVGPEVASHFPDTARPIVGSDRSFLDLRAEIRLRLLALGFSDDAVLTSEACTAESPERFFSHRRDGFPAGRMAAYLYG